MMTAWISPATMPIWIGPQPTMTPPMNVHTGGIAETMQT
jgi:hypothetical protein